MSAQFVPEGSHSGAETREGGRCPTCGRDGIDWRQIADRLAEGLRRQFRHLPPKDKPCECGDHLTLIAYEEASDAS